MHFKLTQRFYEFENGYLTRSWFKALTESTTCFIILANLCFSLKPQYGAIDLTFKKQDSSFYLQ